MAGATLSPVLPLPLFRRGKVRDTYELGDDLLMVASDRLSAFDVVLPTPITGKGAVLSQLSRFWFGRTGHIVPNHLITADVAEFPAELQPFADFLRGRSMIVRRAERIDIECVVRGYLAGSGWAEYRQHGTLAGEPLPSGLLQCQQLPEPRFTPAAKNDTGHDENISRVRLREIVGPDVAQQLESLSLALYAEAAAYAHERGVIIADTKFEFGWIDSRLTLIDEALTPDSSRFWEAASHEPGRDQASFDKQFVRDWLNQTGWDKNPPGPELPESIVAGTISRYREAYGLLTGEPAPTDQADASHGGTPVSDAVRTTYQAEVTVLPKEGVNDPEGEAIHGGLKSLGYAGVDKVRAGRVFHLSVEADSAEDANAQVTRMCDQLLANPVIQTYHVAIVGSEG